jgi:hypothetical protein
MIGWMMIVLKIKNKFINSNYYSEIIDESNSNGNNSNNSEKNADNFKINTKNHLRFIDLFDQLWYFHNEIIFKYIHIIFSGIKFDECNLMMIKDIYQLCFDILEIENQSNSNKNKRHNNNNNNNDNKIVYSSFDMNDGF